MCIADISHAIHNAIQRHASQFKEVDFLTIHARHVMIGVGQADEGQAFIVPIAFEGFHIIGANGKDLGAAPGKIGITISQARQRRAAIRSHKAAQEVQHNHFVIAKA